MGLDLSLGVALEIRKIMLPLSYSNNHGDRKKVGG